VAGVSVLARITRAREALVDGDHDVALAILLELEHELQPRRSTRLRCPNCPLEFAWPGERDAHVARVHGFGDAA
jgi:hypothetical protein